MASSCSCSWQLGLPPGGRGRVAALATKLHRTWTPGRRVSSEKRYAPTSTSSTSSRNRQTDDDRAARRKQAVPSADETGSDAGEEEYDEEDRDDGNEEQEELRSPSWPSERVSQLNCVHFSRCSGCVFENGLNRPPVLQQASSFFQSRHVHGFRFVPSATHGWRCRAKLAVRGTAQEPLVGLYEEQSHNVVDIRDCQAHHSLINQVTAMVKDVVKELGVQPYDEVSLTGQLRYIQVIVNTYVTSVRVEERYRNARAQVSLVWNARDERSRGTELLHKMAEVLWKRGGEGCPERILHSVWANFQTTHTNIILGHRWRRLYGEEDLWERVGGVDICYTPFSFGQANYQAFEQLLRRLQRYVRKGSAVADLYAGVGVIGLSLAATRNCRIVKCVEVNKLCRASFERTLERLPKSVTSQISWHCADATEAPVTWLEGSDVVIVDPPRKGLSPGVIEALRTASLRAQGRTRSPSLKNNNRVEKRPWILRAKQGGIEKDGIASESGAGIWPERLIYVSCSWDAFQEDCEALERDGLWHVGHAQAFNFFPGTDSIELLAVFNLGKRPKDKRRDSVS